MWTKEWPTGPGYYWFHGWMFEYHYLPPRTHLIKVCPYAGGTFCLSDSYGKLDDRICCGVWHPATLPEPPEDFEESQERTRT